MTFDFLASLAALCRFTSLFYFEKRYYLRGLQTVYVTSRSRRSIIVVQQARRLPRSLDNSFCPQLLTQQICYRSNKRNGPRRVLSESHKHRSSAVPSSTSAFAV